MRPEPASEQDHEYLELKQSALKQNKLKEWKPCNTLSQNVIISLLLGTAFVGIGILYIILSSLIRSVTIPYSGDSNTLRINFNIPSTMSPPIYLYYTISNMHQNYRRFAASKSIGQLTRGEHYSSDLKSCYPVTLESQRISKIACNTSHRFSDRR